MSQPPHILILGAGITGLLLAQGLRAAGIPYTIFDGEPYLNARTREWTLNVHFAERDLRFLLPGKLYERLREAYTDPYCVKREGEVGKMLMLNSKTGEVLHEMPTPDLITVSRKRMRVLCSEGVDVRWGKVFVGANITNVGKVEAVFEDGERVLGDLLVGADGTRSMVRDVLVGKEKAERELARIVLATGIVKYGDAEVARRVRSVDPDCTFGYHPDGMFNMIAIANVPDPEDPTTWEFYLAQSILGEPPETVNHATLLANIKKAAEKLVDPFRTSILEIHDESAMFNDKLYYWTPKPWDNLGGKITLAGDAAHPMPPFRGQGLGQSIRDVALLVKSLKDLKSENVKKALPAIIDTYEKEMIKRGAEEVEMSVRAMYMVHDWEKLMHSPSMKIGSRKISEVEKS